MTIDIKCEELDLAAFLDGEVAEPHAFEIEGHLAGCEDCRGELNLQKQMLRLLDGGLKRDADIDLPVDFAKHIVKKAQNNVSGLRPASERFNAIFVVAALSLAALFAIGTESAFFGGLRSAVEQASAVAGFIGQTAYSFLLGLFVLVRTFASVFSNQAGQSLMAVAMVIVVISFSITIGRIRRA